MTVQLISTWEEFAALEQPWNSLAGGMPFRSWDWLGTWWKYYGCSKRHEPNGKACRVAEQQLFVLAVFDDQFAAENSPHERKLLGIAPWYLTRSLVHGRVIRWLGSGEVCTDHLSLVSRPEDQDRVANAIADALTNNYSDWDWIDLRAIDANDVAIANLLHRLTSHGCLVLRQPAAACWIIDLPRTWNDYLTKLSKSNRRRVRKLEREVLSSNRVQWHRVENQNDFEIGWPLLVKLHQKRWRSLGYPGCFASQAFHDFHHEVANRLLKRGQLRLSWLELDTEPVAAEYHIADATNYYVYQGGMDPARSHYRPGQLANILCIRRAIEDGLQHFDFLRGNEQYKENWRGVPHATFDYRIAANRRVARLRGRAINLAYTARGWVRQLRIKSLASTED